MRRHTLIVILIVFAVSTLNTSAQDDSRRKDLTGAWMGKINPGAISMRVVFNLSYVDADSLVATLDSPDQGVKGIKLGPVTLNENTIRISAGALLAEYNGTIKNDTLIEGKFTQAGATLDLNLTRLVDGFSLRRPQEPVPPLPYRSEELEFENKPAGIKLSGTLTIPEGEGPFPAVILITGSGAQNRNEELMGHKPFLVIADHLTRNGIAVLRYDDRGTGRSQGIYASATSADLATDAAAALDYLKTRRETDPGAIGLAGHSEGGLIAPIVASSRTDVAFIVSLAGPGVKGEDLIHRQNLDLGLAMGASPSEMKESIAVNRKLYAVLKKEPDNARAEIKIRDTYSKILDRQKITGEEKEAALKQLAAGFNPGIYTWYRYFITTDPATFWKKTRCPVLALNGEKDLQVAADVNLQGIEKALRSGGNNTVTIVRLPGLNHLFQTSSSGLPAEYGEIEETFSPEVLTMITDWILGL